MDERSAALMRQTWPRQAISLLLLAVVLFAPAGTVRFWHAWLYAFIFVASSTALGIYFMKHDPALLERRMRAGPAAEQEPTQNVIIFMVLVGFVALLVVPGFDHRWGWSSVPPWLVLVADVVVALSFVVFFVVMKQNSYAASTVRVEPNQPVISTGLYGTVRHPMYSGALLLLAFTPLALGSYWALIVSIAMMPVLAWRLLDEERVLIRELPGYAAYRERVRYRLIPGLW